MQTINPGPVGHNAMPPAIVKKSVFPAKIRKLTPRKLNVLLRSAIFLVMVCFAGSHVQSQTTIFSQDFSSSTLVPSYVSVLPNSGQFDAITTAGTSSVAITSGALAFTRGNSNASFTRSTDFSPEPKAIVYRFNITVSGTPGGNTNSAAAFQAGSGFNILTNNVEATANTFAFLGIDFRGTSNFRFRDVTNNNTSSNYSVGTTYTVTWALNNSGSSLTYTAPSGASETIANDRADIWIGNTRVWNDVAVQTNSIALTDLKFAFTQSTGTISIDNINIYSINPFITTQPVSSSVCAGNSTSFTTAATGTSLSYQWKKNGSNLANGGNISGANAATLNINSCSVSDAATYTVDITSSGGYTATSNSATLTIGSAPTITSSSTANAVCYSTAAQNSSLSYSATTGSPTTYTITWNSAALAAGLVNVGSTTLPASPITIPVAAGVGAATYTGTLTVSNASCSGTGTSFTLTVNNSPAISGTLNVCAGATTTLTGTGTPASDPWESASTSIATVNASGVVTGVSAGSSVITYTTTNGCSQSATVTVNAQPGILVMSPTSASTCNGIAKSLTVNNFANNSPQTTGSGAISVTIPDNLASGGTSSITVSGIPSDATITGVSVNFNLTHTYDGDIIINVKAPNNNVLNLVNRRGGSGDNFTNTTISSSGSTAISGGSAPFTGTYTADAANGIGATSNVSNVTSFSSLYGTPNGNWVFSVRDIANGDAGTITSWSVTITYTTPSITWTTNVTDLYTDAAATIPYTSQNTSTVYAKPTTTQTYTATATGSNGCTRSNTVIVSAIAAPSITNATTATDVCYNSTAQSSTLSYSAVSGSSVNYSITWDAAALAAGLINLTNTAITSSPLSIPVAGGVAPGTYTGTIAVTNAGCTSTGSSFTITINAAPTLTASVTAVAKCFSSSYQNGALTYSATTGSPTQYSIVWDAVALSAGLTNVSNASLAGSPVSFPIPAATSAGMYNGTMTVSNAIGCSSAGSAFTQEIAALPTITPAASAATKCFSTSSQTSTLTYSASSGTPTLYSITWDVVAQTAGLTNLGWTTLSTSPVSVPVAANVLPGTYNGTIRVMSGAGCQSASGVSFTLTIVASSAPVMTSASTASICSGSAVNIPLTSNIPATYTWIATDNINVTGESLTLQTTSTLNNTLTHSLTTARTVTYTVRPTSTIGGCEGNAQTVTVTVNPIPSITSSATAASRCYNTSAQTSTLTFSATTANPATYKITWNAAALAAGLVSTGNVALPSSTITFSVPAGVVAGTYTGILTVATTSGCNSTGNTFTFTITAAPSITSQPSSTTVCSGSSASFSIAASGSGLTYQWRKGTTNICSCANISGATSPVLTINPAGTGDAASNYNCVVSSAGCSNTISNFATLTVTAAAAAPTALPKDLVFPTVSTTSILGSFTASSDATHYLVVRKTTNVAPTNPSNGTTYSVNSTVLTGNVDYVGTSTSFTSNGLTPGTTYYYWVFPYNISTCGTSPMYFTSTPLTGEVTTATNVACGTVTTLYWGGTGSALSGAISGTDFNTAANWSTSSSSYVASPAAPTECNNVSLALIGNASITLSGTTSVYGLNFTISGNNLIASLSSNGNTLTVNDNAVIDVLSGNNNTSIYIGEAGSGAGIVDFKGNFKIGETYYSGSIPKSYIVGNINSKITFRGDVLFGRTARFTLPGGVSYPPTMPTAVPGTGTTPGTIEFDGIGLQQVLWNNNVYYDCFYNIVVGNQNKPYVKHVTGTYTPDNILNDFTINDGCTVDLGTSQWIREASGGTFTMNGNAKLILGNYRSIKSNCGTGCSTGITIAGSNFPGGFATLNISSGSTIEYNGGNSITQTVYNTPTYGNLILSNTDGTGIANKISSGTVSVNGTATVSDKTTFTPGTNVVVDGTATVNNGGTWIGGTNIVTGSGTFNVANGGTLTIASAEGITASGATGNIQTTARVFGTGGNYTYNGATAQATGSGLPTTMNNLTISNAAGVTMYAASRNYTVAGTLALTSGAFSINGDSLTINNLTRTSGTLTGSSTSSVGVSGINIPLFFTSGSRILKDLFLNTNASADLQTALDITAGSSAGSVAVSSGAILNTHDFLTLKSDANGTARVAEIPVNGSGTALGSISGNITIERYIPGKRAWRMVTAPVQATGTQTINDAWQEGVVNADISNNQNPNPGFGVHISGSDPSLGFDVTPLNNPSLKVFNRTTSGWVGIPNTLSTYVRDYEGYMIFVRGSRSTNLIQNTGATTSNTVIRETDGIRMGRQSVTLGSTAGNYSVVGNPYPSTIDFRTLSISGLGSTKTFVMWDPALTGINGVGAYQYFTQSGGAGTDYTVFPGGGSYGISGTVNNFVQSGQAFLIQNTGAATLTINESSKASSSTSTVFRPMPDNITGKISTILYGFEADSTTTVLDGGLVMYRSEYDDNMDLDDVKKMSNSNSENFGLNKGGTVYQIEKRQSISENDTIHYSMRNLRARTYQLVVELKNIESAGVTAYLKDNYTGVSTALDYNTPYKFTFTPTNAAAGSYAADRFKIYFKEVIVLPVTFTSLDAYRKNDKIDINWKVQNESNIRHYEVEKSSDGVNFSRIGNIVAATNSNTYQLVDEAPQQGLNYFRVKAVENNRRIKYTNIAKVFFGKNTSGITVFPNPVTDGRVNLYITGEQRGEYHTNLFNTNGQLIQTNKLGQLDGNSNTTIEINKDLPHGNYILEVVKPDLTKEHINIVY
jgi:subtilisin-like proprotein convertase family protein